MNLEIICAPPLSSVAVRSLRQNCARHVLAGKHTLRDRRPDDLRDAQLLAGRHDLGLDDPPQHRVLRLVRDQLEAELLRHPVAGTELVRAPLADADVQRLARTDHVSERLHRLLERRLRVVPVGLVQVDVIGAKTLQRPVDRLHDVLAGQPAVVSTLRARRPVHLGEDLQRLTPLPLQCVSEYGLGDGVRVRVGRVEGRDPRVERCSYAQRRCVVLHLRPVGQPVAVADLRDLEAGVTEVTELHACTFFSSLASASSASSSSYSSSPSSSSYSSSYSSSSGASTASSCSATFAPATAATASGSGSANGFPIELPPRVASI